MLQVIYNHLVGHNCCCDKRWRKTYKEESHVYWSKGVARILVSANQSTAIKCKHKVNKHNNHDVQEDLEFVEIIIDVWSFNITLARDLHDYHSGKSYRCNLHDPVFTHDHDCKSEDEFAHQLHCREPNDNFAFFLILCPNHSRIKSSPGCSEILMQYEFFVVHAVENND